MLVSLFTDASVCGQTGVAGWGYWAKSERGRAYGGAPFDGRFEIVSAAEMAAVVMGLRRALVERVALPGDRVLVQSDNLEAVRAANGHRPRGRTAGPAMEPYWLELFEVVVEHRVTILARHVRGHQSGEPRYFVNGVADDYAGRGMRAARAMLDKGVTF